MAWLIRILISAIAAGLAGISIFLATLGAYAFYGNEIAQLPPSEPGEFGDGFLVLIFAGYGALLAIPILFIIFIIFYKRLNMLGLLLGVGFGFWFSRLVQHLAAWTQAVEGDNPWIYEYLNMSAFIFILVGLFFIKHDTKRFSLAGTVAGAAGGFLISYGAVIAYRWVDNTLTSYGYFGPIETTVVLFGVLLFALIGNAVGNKYRRKLNGHSVLQESA
ncbi:hypothetical protein [Planococcus halotolerans]|uniref:hypothetical protein n=1 Tax=Planococcus halotolerans TaxID=2233542 RepID=UPI0010927D9A|nr:hypothetical protein [Planococcus halotolerans]QHJ70566.1 hypothetical protein DNR44_008090 [Planococcus halotolerans]